MVGIAVRNAPGEAAAPVMPDEMKSTTGMATHAGDVHGVGKEEVEMVERLVGRPLISNCFVTTIAWAEYTIRTNRDLLPDCYHYDPRALLMASATLLSSAANRCA